MLSCVGKACLSRYASCKKLAVSMVTIVGVTDLCWELISAPGSSKIGHSLLAALVCCRLWLCGWLLCQGELPALSAGGAGQPVSLLGHVHAVSSRFQIIFSFFRHPSVRTPQGRSFSNVLWPNEKERRWITILHILFMLKGFYNTINY